MTIVSEDRAVSPGVVSQSAATIRLVALRLSPVLMALVVEPWAAAGVALDLLRRAPGAAENQVTYGLAANARDLIRSRRHVVNASFILLGLAATIIATLMLTHESPRTWSDEVAWIAAAFMLGSLALSFGGIGRPVQMRIAHGSFLAGMAAILMSLVSAACQLPR